MTPCCGVGGEGHGVEQELPRDVGGWKAQVSEPACSLGKGRGNLRVKGGPTESKFFCHKSLTPLFLLSWDSLCSLYHHSYMYFPCF